MAIKAWSYGGKPGIAVSKETKPRLLTVWPFKLWGAVAPVAESKGRKKSEENQGRKHKERNNQCCSCFVLGETVTLSNLWIGAWW